MEKEDEAQVMARGKGTVGGCGRGRIGTERRDIRKNHSIFIYLCNAYKFPS